MQLWWEKAILGLCPHHTDTSGDLVETIFLSCLHLKDQLFRQFTLQKRYNQTQSKWLNKPSLDIFIARHRLKFLVASKAWRNSCIKVHLNRASFDCLSHRYVIAAPSVGAMLTELSVSGAQSSLYLNVVHCAI